MITLIKKYLPVFYFFQLMIFPIQAETPSSAPMVTSIDATGDQVTLDMSQLMPYEVFTLTSPWRLVVEVQGAVYKAGVSKKSINGSLVRRIRGYQFKENPLVSRIVVDLNAPVDYKSNANGNQVVISLAKNQVLAKQEAHNKPAPAPAVTPRKGKRDLLGSLPKEEVTLDFEGADIRDVIRLMAETSNINIIFGPEVAGTIAVHLRKVPFDEAFSTILNLKGLVASQLGTNILRVTTPELLQKERQKAVMFTKSIPINYLKAEEMQKHLQSVMSSAGRKGTITVVTETNSIVLTDSEEGIGQAERLVAQLDKRPKQVMIEARIVEINLNNGFDIGVQWEFFNENASANKYTFTGVNDPDEARISVQGANTEVGAVPPTANGTGVALPGPAAAGITFGFINADSILTASLAALITQSKAKILSAPKVVTINGAEASIEAVQDIRFRKSTVSNGVVTSDFETVKAGIVLNVTPTINAEDSITLKIAPESSFPTQESTEAGPIIRTRTAQTTVIVKDGDTLVIGGLIDDQDTKGVNKVPVLGDIPIIGVFFRSNTNRKIRNELLVFVTPRIVRD